MKQASRFVLTATPLLLVGVPMLELMGSAPGLLIASLLVALLAARFSGWQNRPRFWPFGLLGCLLPALLYGAFVIAQVTGIAGTPWDRHVLDVPGLLLYFLLNSVLVFAGLLAGLLLWRHLCTPVSLASSSLESPAALD